MTVSGRQDKARAVYGHYAYLIDSGTLKPGDRLPAYPELKRRHQISHVTATAVVRALKNDLYIRTTTAGIVVYLGGTNRMYQVLCNALNDLEDAGQLLQVEEFGGLACIAGHDGGACWNPEKRCWEAPRN